MISLSRIAAPAVLLAALALSGCATAGPDAGSTSAAPSASPTACDGVTIVVDFGVLDKPSVKACAKAGAATAALKDAGVTTVGTADYGDQVVCRVNNEPAPDETVTIKGQTPFVESCNTLNSVAYWALWVKASADAKWDYAQEGANTLQLTDGQSLGLVYTPGTESTPPQD